LTLFSQTVLSRRYKTDRFRVGLDDGGTRPGLIELLCLPSVGDQTRPGPSRFFGYVSWREGADGRGELGDGEGGLTGSGAPSVGGQPDAREIGQLSTFKNSQPVDLTLSAG
ncbi:MAG: hypothetical protein ABSH25_12295, partial [Syntrophorhabdales bacterium]